MGRRASVTRMDVEAAIRQLEADGKEAAPTPVWKITGGDFHRVKRMVEEVLAERQANLLARVGEPPAVKSVAESSDEQALAAITKIWVSIERA